MKTIAADVQLHLDERSAQQVSNQIERTLQQSGSEASNAFGSTFSRHMADVGDDAAKSIQNALRGGVDEAVRGVSSQFGAMSGVAQSALSGISTGAAAAGLGVAALAVGVVKVGEALYEVGQRFDNLSDTMSVQTGRMGDDLDQLMSTVKDVGATTAASFETIGDIVGRISQSMPDLAGNSDAMREMASNLAYLAENGKAVDIRDLGRSFQAFGVDSDHAAAALDKLYAASARTGDPMNELLKNLVNVGPAARSLGLDFEDTAGLLVTFEESGIDAGKSTQALNSAAKVFADANIPLKTGLADTITQIRGFIAAGNDAAAVDLAGKVFGSRGAQQFVDLIRQGKLNVDDMKASLGDTDNKIGDLKDSTEDWSEQWEILKNRVSELADIAGGPLFDALNKALGVLNTLLAAPQSPYSGSSGTYPGHQSVPLAPSPGGGIVPPGTGAIQGNGMFLDSILGANAGVAAPPGLVPPPSGPGGPPQDISQALADAQKKSGSGPKLPDAPVLPYDQSLPPGFANLPQTSSIVAAEQAWMDARHTLAEKNARVTQLESDANAKADDIQRARNDVINAQQAQQQAELRLNDARQALYDKANKQLSSYADQMGDIGAKLDNDFGISKGLPGLAENLFKFLANLAAAPIEGMLGAIGKANPNEGSGLVGVLAAQGAFGQQFVKSQDPYSPLSSGAGTAATSLNTLATAANAATGALGGGGSGGSSSTSGGGSSWWPGASVPSAGSSAGRVPYGLPRGSSSGGYGGGGVQFPDWVNQIAQQFGIKPSTYPGHQETNRSEAGFAPNPMDLNRAIDWSGPVPNMERFADYLATIPQDMEQVIWQNPQTGHRVGIAGGRDVSGSGYYADDFGGHQNHVHTRQSLSIPLPGGPLAAGSAGGGWASPRSAGGGGGGTGTGSWFPGVGGPTQGLPGIGMGLPGISSAAIGGGAAAGMGTGMQPPAVGGPGMNVGGGLIGAAEGAAAMAADAFMPGTGALVQMGSQILNKTIEFGGKVAGIGVSEIGDFFSIGDNPRASLGNSWLGRMAGGIAGAKPALPNLAGKKPPDAMTGDQASKPAAGGGQGGNTFNTTVNNNRATEDGTGRDLNRHLEAMTAAPGRQ